MLARLLKPRSCLVISIFIAFLCVFVAQSRAGTEGTTFDGLTIDPAKTPSADRPTYPVNIKDASGNAIFRVDTSGNITYLAGNSGYPQTTNSRTLTKASHFTAAVGISVTAAELRKYNTFYVDLSQITSVGGINGAARSGVSIVLPTPTADIDGKPITFIKSDSGTTQEYLYSAGKINTSSGVTDGVTADAQGDSITVIPHYNATPAYTVIHYINR